MIRILFVCHGNICRSPMAEFIMKHLVNQSGCEDKFYISSAAATSEETGNDRQNSGSIILNSRSIEPERLREVKVMNGI